MYADITCPWAHLAVHRLHETRADLGLVDDLVFDVRAFPLELINERTTPKLIIDAEIPVVGQMAPDAGWQIWQRAPHEWPVSTLLAMEAVEAAKEQGLRASETLDRALRRAFFAESRTISVRHEILDVATSCPGVDPDALREALVAGRARRAIEEQFAISTTDHVRGSPHLFLPDGTDVHNPGVTLHWEARRGAGFPVVDHDDPTVYPELVRRAAGRPDEQRRAS